MNKKVILLLGDVTSKGGIEKVSITLVNKLNSTSGFDASIISLYKGNDETIIPLDNSDVSYLSLRDEVSMYNRRLSLLKGLFFDFFYILKKGIKLRQLFNNGGEEYIICSDVKMTLLAYLSTCFLNKKIVAIEHFEYDVPNALLKKLRVFLYKKIHHVVILTKEDENKYNWLKPEKFSIIPNIVDINTLQTTNKKNKIIAAGRLCHQKGFDLLIESWNMIYKKYPDWSLEIYGDGEDELMLRNKIEMLNVKNLSILPFSKNIDEIYSQSKIFVLSSRFEGLGMVLIEALAHSLCCVSFDCPAGPKTIIKNGYNGLLVETGNVDELADSLGNVLDDNVLRDRLSSNAVASIERFTTDKVISQWRAIFDGK